MNVGGKEQLPLHWKQIVVFLILALGLQYQVIIPLDSTGLRICPGDLVAAGLLLVVALRKPNIPCWRAPGLLPALTLATASLGLGLAVAWHSYGELTSWAVINRFIGWFSLMVYLATGIVLGAFWGTQGRDRFIRILTKSIVILSGIGAAIAFVLYWVDAIPVEYRAIPLRGFVQNRNAFSFLILSTIALVITDTSRTKPLFPGWQLPLYLALLGLFLIFAGSRASIPLAGAIILAACRWGGLRSSALMRSALFALTIMAAVIALRYGLAHINGISQSSIPPLFVAETYDGTNADPVLSNSSDLERVASFTEAFHQWRASPWIGSGLGSFLQQHLAKTGRPLIIHNTLLWILTELGVVGLVAFGTLAGVIVRGLWRCDALTDQSLRLSTLLLLGTFVSLSMVHDVMYQRILWLVIGLALAVPSRTDAAPCAE